MEPQALVMAFIALAGTCGGIIEGRRQARSLHMGVANDTVSLLQVQVATLSADRGEKDGLINDLRVRVEVLESLVTQRAEVEKVHVTVKGIRGVVERIATKVGA